MVIKTKYFDWKEEEAAKKFIRQMHKEQMKVYHLEKNWDAYALIAAKQKPNPKQIVGLKANGYKISDKDAMLPLTEITEKDFEEEKPKSAWW